LLAPKYLPGEGRSLADCCAAFGVTISDAHRASADALATAHLLAAYLRKDPGGPLWKQELELAGEHPWPDFVHPSGKWVAREHAARQGHFVERLSLKRMDSKRRSVSTEHAKYLTLLDHALLDRHISVAEADALVALAAELGIGRTAAVALHRSYLGQLASADADPADLREVAVLLGLAKSDVDKALRSAPAESVVRRFALATGDKVVFTGEMRCERPEWEQRAVSAGLLVHPAVTKTVKLLVAADPDTLSGKGRKARDYGIPVITEDAFAGMLARIKEPT
jgi:DNA polymerase-3 subunit epsilon